MSRHHDIMAYHTQIQRSLLVAVILYQLTVTLVSGKSSGLRPPTKLRDILPTDYDNFQTPKEEGKPTNVTIQIELLNIRSVNVKEMSYIADIFLYKTWKDTRLNYPAKYFGLEKISLNPDWRKELWTPDVYFHNAIEGRVQDTIIPYLYLWLKNDSTVIFGARLSLQFSCDMMLYYFPHDTQCCDIIVKSLTHTLSEMLLQWNETHPIIVGDFIVLPQFEYGKPFTDSCDKTQAWSRRGDFACLRGVIKLNRRSGYYVINIYIPTILIVFMSMLTFWIPPDAVPGRVTLGVTSILTIITKQYQASLPSVSYVVALNVWLSCCIGFVFCSLLEYAAVIALLARQKRKSSESIATSANAHAAAQNSETYWVQLNEKIMSKIESINCHTIDRVSRFLFPLVFAFQCIVYWTYYTMLDGEECHG